MTPFKYQLLFGFGAAQIIIGLIRVYQPSLKFPSLTCISIANGIFIFGLISTDKKTQKQVAELVREFRSKLNKCVTNKPFSSKYRASVITNYKNENNEDVEDSIKMEFYDRQNAELYIKTWNQKIREGQKRVNYVVGLHEYSDGDWKPVSDFINEETQSPFLQLK